jgi:GDPmannose 4,6-dehydratase
VARRALVTGISGQDGAYLAKLLLDKGYEVFGGVRRSARSGQDRLSVLGIAESVRLVDFDLAEVGNIFRLVRTIRPDELYNLAAQSFVAASWEFPLATTDVNAVAVTRILEAIRLFSPETRFYQASTSEMFGQVRTVPQNEDTPFHPRSPYGVSKLYGHWMTVNYRESFGLHASSGILFNHESPLRGREFVTRKISLGLARVAEGLQDCIILGNLDAKRDWGFAGDYVEGMWRMLQREAPSDFVLASGETRSVRSFVETAAETAGFQIRWQGSATDEVGIDAGSGRTIVRVSSEFYRPAEVDLLLGDASKAARELDWRSTTSVEDIAAMMVQADLDDVRRFGDARV